MFWHIVSWDLSFFIFALLIWVLFLSCWAWPRGLSILPTYTKESALSFIDFLFSIFFNFYFFVPPGLYNFYFFPTLVLFVLFSNSFESHMFSFLTFEEGRSYYELLALILRTSFDTSTDFLWLCVHCHLSQGIFKFLLMSLLTHWFFSSILFRIYVIGLLSHFFSCDWF